MDPGLALSWSALARSLHGLGQLEECIVATDHCLEIDPNFFLALGPRAASLWQLGRGEEAISVYDHALKAGSRKAVFKGLLRGGQASALATLGRFEEAISASRKAQLEPVPTHRAYYGELVALVQLGRLEEAKAAGARARKAYPDFGLPRLYHDYPMPAKEVREMLVDAVRLALGD